MNRLENMESDVYEVLRELLAQFSDGSATIETKRIPEIEHDGVLIVMQPKNPKCARIMVDAKNGNDTITLNFGHATPVEIFIAKDKFVRDEVTAFCLPVMQGKFKEEVTLVGEEIIGSKSEIEVNGKKHTFHYRGRFHPFKRARKETYEYAPY